jgi:uncharacterized protein YqgC (DUF456 family)
MDNTLIFTAILMGMGVLGCVIPVLPGPPLVWLGAMYHGYQTNWSEVSVAILILLFVLAMVGSTADTWMGYLGARSGGASIWSSLAGAAGGMIGLIVLNLPGAILGSLAAVAAVEWYRHRDWSKVLSAGTGYLKGFLLSMVVQFFICLLMIGIFVMALRL